MTSPVTFPAQKIDHSSAIGVDYKLTLHSNTR